MRVCECESVRDCVSVCVPAGVRLWCPFFRVRALHGVLNTLGSPSAPSLRERPSSAAPLTRRTHHCAVSCALRDRIPSHSLSSCSTATQTEARDRLCPVPIAWPPVWSASRSALLNLITSDLMSTHGARANAPLSREVSWLCAQTPVSLRLDLTLNWGAAPPPHSSESFTLLEWHRHLGGLKYPSQVGFLPADG